MSNTFKPARFRTQNAMFVLLGLPVRKIFRFENIFFDALKIMEFLKEIQNI